MANGSKRGRGRAPDDWAKQIRLWIWLAKLRQMHWPSDYWMDKTFLPKSATRHRVFERMRRDGNDPEPSSIKRYGYSVVDRISTHRMFKGSDRWYRSPLFDLLIPRGNPPRGMTTDEAAVAMYALAKLLGQFRATTNQRWVGREFLPDERAFEPYSADRFKEFIEFLRTRSHIDDVAMLALLYREAVAERIFQDAGLLWREFHLALMSMAIDLALPEEQTELLVLLARRRIGKDDWSPLLVSADTKRDEAEHSVWIGDMFKIAGHKEFGEGLKGFQRTELSMLILQERIRPSYEEKFNWTPMTPGLQYLLDHFDKFEASARHDFMKSLSEKMEVVFFDDKDNLKSKRVIKNVPPRPRGMKTLVTGLEKAKTRKK